MHFHKFGGCIIGVDESGNNIFEYHCENCGYEYNKAKAIDFAYSKIENIKGYVGGYFQGHQYFEINLLSRRFCIVFKKNIEVKNWIEIIEMIKDQVN